MLRLHRLAPRGLKPIDLDLKDGNCLCVTGPSGSGKTVFLRAIADLDVNGGEAETAGVVRSQVSAPEWRKTVAYVPAESGWWADCVGPHFPNGDPDALLQALGLGLNCLEWEVTRLSTGERQRLALARAIILKPQVLLLDEPTSALDEKATAAVEDVLKNDLAAGTTIILVTHDIAQISRLGGLHAVVNQGCVTVKPL